MKNVEDRHGENSLQTNPDENLQEELIKWVRTEKAIRDLLLKQAESRPTKTRRQRFREILNESFTLWLLSSVLLGGLSWAYTEWDESRIEREANRSSIMKLDIEIASRVRRSAERFQFAHDQVGVNESIAMLDQGSGVFNEFDDRAFESLLIELGWMVPSGKKQAVESARQAIRRLQKLRGPPTAGDIDPKKMEQVRTDFFAGYFAIRGWQDEFHEPTEK